VCLCGVMRRKKRRSRRSRSGLWESCVRSVGHDQVGHSFSGRFRPENSRRRRETRSTNVRRDLTRLETVDERHVFLRDTQYHLSQRTFRRVEKIVSAVRVPTPLFALGLESLGLDSVRGHRHAVLKRRQRCMETFRSNEFLSVGCNGTRTRRHEYRLV